eukprot:CAMPEP_0202475184 /NCGR_PEP_ID=MMETSP1360-20130828/92768_1 /ASSEMBLY_ACC=CAM_ASM_000848 /TAXON_ID=515479 /ORGANISM="Licmophora paradoxa, Strain CCMP2313" /LENGTH=115 /DNA_ID=CAMNT_0049102331 /DNA_START=1030 /DNA_END=1377 /DNA_ORIENTATION=-
MNPDTDQINKYQKLSCCSKGYLQIGAKYCSKKENLRRIRFTVGRNLINHPDQTSTKAANITTVKIVINSILSTRAPKFATFDLKDFYLNTTINEYEYMRIPLAIIPKTILNEYKL